MKSLWISSLVALAVCSTGRSADLPAKHAGRPGSTQETRIVISPRVRAVVNANSPEGRLARAWVRYAQGLLGEGGLQIEDVVTADVHCIELDAAGYPPGLAGLKLFRQQINTAFPDERALLTQMSFSGTGMIETELRVTGTNLGPLLGRAPTGRTVRFAIHTLGRFKGERLAERWDRMDFAGLLRQLGDGAN